MRLKHLLSVFLTLLTFAVGQVWGAKDDAVASVNPTADLGAGQNYNPASNDDWAVNVTNNSAFGTNAKSSNNDKLKLSNNSSVSTRNTAIATALAAYTEAEFTVNTQYVAALIGLTELSNVGKVGVTYGGTNGGNPDDMWVLYSTNSGSTYSVAGHTSSVSSGTNITFTSTISSAQYAVVFKRSAAFGIKSNPTITFYEGATQPTCTAPSITAQPTGGNYNKNAAATLSVTASGTSLTYQWYLNTTNSTTGATIINGATNSSHSPSTATGGTMYYYCIVSSGTCTTTSNIVAVTVNVPVSSISLNKNSTSIVENQTETLTATVSPDDATNKTVNWSTSDASIATVSGGVVTAKAVGTATITATSAADNSKSASCTVTVTAAPKDHFIDEVQGSSVADKTSAYDISTVTIADKSVATSGSCEAQHYHFVGWITKAKYDEGTAISNSDIQTGNKTPNNSTYYAVWAKQGAGGGSTTYTLVTAASQLSTGDRVVLVDGNPASTCNGVTGWSGNKDATISTTTANWVKYYVTKSNDNWTLKDETSNKFIKSPGGNEFIYDATTGGSFAADEDGLVKCNNRYLAINGSMYRFYQSSTISTNSYDVFYMYKVGSNVTYTDYIAKCCTPLGSIKGSVSEDQPTSATLTWDVKDNVTWTVSYKVKNAAGEASTANVGTITTSEGKNHCTITGLNPATTYEFYVHATATGYCENEETWTIEGTTAAAHTITAVSSNSTYGIVSLSGNVITGEPADYCQYASPTFTVTSGTADVTQEGNVFTVDPSSDCTVQINFEKIPVYTVNLNAGTGSVASSSLPEEYRTLGVTLPVATAPTGWSFVGWTTASVTETATRPATIYSASSTYIPSADGETLYAVYEQWDGNENEFQRVTALNGLAAGDRVVVVSNGIYKHTLATDNGSFKKNATAYTADANNKISVSDNKHIWTLGSTNTTNVYTLTNVATGTTLGASALCGSGNNEKQKDVSLTSTNNQWLLTKSGTDFVIKNNPGTSYLETASGGFCIYYQYNPPSGNPLSDYYQMLIFKGTAEKKYATAPKSVKALAVKTAPTTAYRVGDVFDATGTILDATYSDDTHGDITEGYTYVVNNLSDGKLTAESNQVTYTYKGQTANLAITAGTLSSIVITTEPAKKKYAEGESFDATGMAVKAVFSNGLEIADVNGYTFSDAALTPSEESVTISYTYGEDTKTTTQAISVGSLSSIAVTTAPSTTSYTEGTAFSTAGMVVTGTYNNGETRVLNGYTIEPSGELSYPCTSVTISYQGKTTTQTITVSEAPKYTVHFWTNGTDNVRQVIQGRMLTDIPTPAAIDGFTFMGWASAELAETTNAPASYALSKDADSYTPEEDNVPFHAVYRRSEETQLNGFKLSYGNNYIGNVSGSYFVATNTVADAEVFFEEATNTNGQVYLYYYDVNARKYISSTGSNTSISFNNKQSEATPWTKGAETGDKVSYTSTNSNGRYIAYNYNNGSTPRFAAYNGSGYDKALTSTSAQKTVNVYYYSTSAVLPVLQSIAITTAPTKTEYFEGDDFEADGMVVTGTYNNGVRVLTASQYTLSPTEDLEAGTTSVTVTAVADNNITASQAITVKAIALTSIEVTTAPTKTVYVVGQTFDPTAMVVTARYNDSRKDKVITTYTMTPSTSTALTAENDHIEISYTEGGITKKVNQAITVNAALTGIEITSNPDKMTYIETETFDATGMVVTAHYNGSDDQIVTASVTWDKTGVLAALNSLENPTVETITFTYEESGAEVTTTLNVTVNPYPRYTVTFSANGTPTNVTEGAGQGGVAVPTNPSAVGDYTFAGWSKSQRAVESAEDPALVTISEGKYYPAGNETLYAVYTMDHEEEVAGMYLTAVVDANNTEKTIGYFYDKSLYPTTSLNPALAFWFKDGYLFYMDGTDKKYVYNEGGSQADLKVGTNAPASHLWEKTTNNDGTITFKRNNNRILAWNSSYFRAYGSSYTYNKFTTTTATETIIDEVPYYTTAPSTDVTPTISFAETSKTITVVDENGELNTCTNTLTTNSTGTVSYVSSNENIATVAANGTVSVKVVGEVTITANVAAVAGTWKAISKSYTLTIEKATASASFGTPATNIVYKDNTIALPATSEQAITITYSCSNTSYATVDASGNVTGVATSWNANNQRQVTIYAEWAETDYYKASTNSTRASQTVIVKNNAKTQTLSFTDEAKDFANNQGDKVYTNTLSGAKTTVTYSSSDDNVAEVDENTGEVTVHTNNVGTATITASAAAENVIEDGITFAYGSASKYYTITINYPEPTISVVSCEIKAPISVELSHDNAAMLMYTLDGSTPSYASNNGEIYDDPIVINDTKTLKAIAVSANEDESLVAEVVYTKITPTVTCNVEDGGSVPAGNGAVSLTAADDVLITYELRNGANTVLASGSDVHSPISLDVTMGSGYKLTILSQWDCENGFSSDVEEITFKATGAGLLPINYSDNTTNLPVYFTPTGLGNYSGDGVNTKIKFSNSGHKLVVQFANEPAKLSYTLKLNGNGTDYVFTVEESSNGTIYTTLKEHNSSNNALSSEETTFSNIELASTTRYIRWTYTTKPSGTNIGLGNISITASSTGNITIDGVNVTEVPNDFHGNVTVVNGGTFDVSEDKTLENLTVEAGGKVSGSATLNVQDMTINSEAGKSGQVTGSDVHINGDIYLDIKLLDGTGTMTTEESQMWYCISAPFEVSFNDGFFWGNGTPMGHNVDFQAFVYDGAKRASNGTSGWQRAGGKMEAGKAYLIGFDDERTNQKTIRLKAMSNTIPTASSLPTEAHYNEDNAQANWNGVGNPTLHYIALDGFAGKVQCYNNGAGYSPYDPATHNYVVGTALFMQADDNIDLKAATNANFRAPKREGEEKENYSFCVEIAKEGATRCDNRLYVSTSDEATSTYEQGKDMQSMNGTSAKFAALIWTENYGMRLASEDVPMVNQKASYTLGIYAPKAGTYSISTVEASEDAELYLTYNGRAIWNLSMSECELELAQGQNAGYGLRLVVKAPSVVTGIDEINAETGVQKVIIDEHVYILRGGQMYDVNGKMVK